MIIERLIYTNSDGESIEFSALSPFHVNNKEMQGINDIRNEVYSSAGIGQRGETVTGQDVESREIELSGSIKIQNRDHARRYARLYTHVLNPELSGTLEYICGDIDRAIDCRVIDSTPSKGDILTNVSVSFLCSNPMWRDKESSMIEFITVSGGLEFPVEIEDWGIGGIFKTTEIDIDNPGDVAVGMVITLAASGTIADPTITNETTGDSISYIGPLVDTESLVIDTRYGLKTMKLNGVSVLAYLDPGSVFIQLAPGINHISYSAATGAAHITATIEFTPEYWGV